MVVDMKKVIWILLLISSFSFAANVYFLNGGSGYIYTNGQTFTSGASGSAAIAYWLWADPAKYSIDEYGANFKDPNGNWSDWSYNSTPQGLFRCLKAGTWEVKGRVHVVSDIYGYRDYYKETSFTLTFTVVDNNAPAAPSNLQLTAGGTFNNKPVLTWNSNSEYDLKNYRIYRKVGTGSWSQIATTTGTTYTDNEVTINLYGAAGQDAYYKIKAEDINNNVSDYSNQVSTEIIWLQKKSEELSFSKVIPLETKLCENYPNPFNPRTNIIFQLKEDNIVNLTVYNSIGEEVAILLNEFKTSGKYSLSFDGENLPSGLYYYRLQTGTFVQTKKMILVK